VSRWGSCKPKQVLAALLDIGWKIKRTESSHRVLEREGWENYTFAFHDGEEIGPVMMSKIAKKTGLKPEDV